MKSVSKSTLKEYLKRKSLHVKIKKLKIDFDFGFGFVGVSALVLEFYKVSNGPCILKTLRNRLSRLKNTRYPQGFPGSTA